MYKGVLSKMRTEGLDPVRYTLPLGETEVAVNDWLGKPIRLQATGRAFCVSCGKEIARRYGQGFCYPCFEESPHNSPCIVRPELCRAHVGEGRDPAWEAKYHHQPHVVYLALSGSIKVGVTLATNVPTRWVDQGASAAVVIARTPYRALAGEIEVMLKGAFGDKTHWQQMLRGEVPPLNLAAERQRAHGLLSPSLQQYAETEAGVVQIAYPILQPLSTVQSVNPEKQSRWEGALTGIRGQYLMIDGRTVLNVRRYAGLEITWQPGKAQPVQGSLF